MYGWLFEDFSKAEIKSSGCKPEPGKGYLSSKKSLRWFKSPDLNPFVLGDDHHKNYQPSIYNFEKRYLTPFVDPFVVIRHANQQ